MTALTLGDLSAGITKRRAALASQYAEGAISGTSSVGLVYHPSLNRPGPGSLRPQGVADYRMLARDGMVRELRSAWKEQARADGVARPTEGEPDYPDFGPKVSHVIALGRPFDGL